MSSVTPDLPLVYVLVPELHKDGAVHFHGFFNDALSVTDSGHADGHGHKVFNLPRWTFGFSTAIKLYGDYAAATAYVCKYVRKQEQKIGGRWFYSGGKLAKPTLTYPAFDLEDVRGLPRSYGFEVEEAGLQFAIYRENGNCPKNGTEGGANDGNSDDCSSSAAAEEEEEEVKT